MKVYDPALLDAIKEKVPLLEYIMDSGVVLNIKRAGKTYKGTCPNHKDRTPSFDINPRTNRYYCFSCGCKGDLFDFMREFENLPFDSAVRRGMQLAGLSEKDFCGSQTVNYLKGYKRHRDRKNERIQGHEVLDEGILDQYYAGAAREWYFEGISVETQKEFDIRLDRDHDRIVYPVRDIKGRLINIKGRTKDPDYKAKRIPKYINYFPVGTMDYFQALDITLPYVMEKKQLIIFESIKSVMKAWQWGYKNCASAEKHTLTEEQIKIIAKLGVDVVLAYDTDVSYYRDGEVWRDISLLRRITNVYLVDDRAKLLGGAITKNAPVDLGQDTWETLYASKVKV